MPNGKGLGECHNGVDSFNENETDAIRGIRILSAVLILFAGTAAESILLGTNPLETRGKGDFDEANKILGLPNDGLGQERSNNATKIVWDVFKTPKAQQQIRAVADALIKDKTLTGSQVAEIMNANLVKEIES